MDKRERAVKVLSTPRLLCFAVSKIWTRLACWRPSWCGRVKKRGKLRFHLWPIFVKKQYLYLYLRHLGPIFVKKVWQEGNYMEEIFWSWGENWTLTGGRSSFHSLDPHTFRHLDILTHGHVEASWHHGIPLGYRYGGDAVASTKTTVLHKDQVKLSTSVPCP